MAEFLKNLARRGLRRAARIAGADANLSRLRGLQAWWQRQVGNPNEINMLRERYPHLVRALDPRKEFALHERKIHSQFGEDGLVLHLFSKIGAPNQTFIEFGIEDGSECNAANLALHFGWRGLLIEGSDSQAERARNFYHRRHGIDPAHVPVQTRFVTRENVNELFSEAGFRGEIDLLSIDVDGVDYWIWDAVSVVSPRLVVIEFNASFGPARSLTVPYTATFDRHERHASGWYHGASLAALTKLASQKGYFLAGCDSSGANAFFVRRDAGWGRVPELTPADAYYPCAPRLREASLEEQWERIRHLPLVEV